jgi:hypothetical protein
MNLSPTVGQVTWTCNCDPFECVGQETGNVIGGPVGGIILSDELLRGLVLDSTFQEARIIDGMTGQIYVDTQNLQLHLFRVLD